jgi:molybdate/tungstate transport system substrate-binding protein
MRYINSLIKTSIVLMLIVSFSGCFRGNQQGEDFQKNLIIFHAGSLSVPFQQIADSFQVKYPDIKVMLEGAGSRECARKISELHRSCDVIATADNSAIEDLLIPVFTNWYVDFATNEMCIAYLPYSRYSNEINVHNWARILMRPDVTYGRLDPNAGPCGYQTIFTMKLSTGYYSLPGLTDSLTHKDRDYVRTKESDLLALLESHTLDYIFIYRSVAERHHLNYVKLPIQINLSNPKFGVYYASATVDIPGKKAGETITKTGEPMVYAVSILNDAPNKEGAIKFVKFLLSEKGRKIMQDNSQPPILYAKPEYRQNIPPGIKPLISAGIKP